MNFGEVVAIEHVVSNEHSDLSVPVEENVLETVKTKECDKAVKQGYKQDWEEDELDLIVFRCRD